MRLDTKQHRILGVTATWGVAVLLLAYLPTLLLGLISLKSPLDPIGDPYFSLMEALIILVAPLMVVSMAVVHACGPPQFRECSLAALVFMVIAAGITSGVHFVVLTVSRQADGLGPAVAPLLFSFKWPSVVYALDILAWDWFYALSMFFGAQVFRAEGLERTLRRVMLASGVLSLRSLIGVPLANMNVRNIGILGYTVVAAVAFLLMGMVFSRTHDAEGGGED